MQSFAQRPGSDIRHLELFVLRPPVGYPCCHAQEAAQRAEYLSGLPRVYALQFSV